MIPRVLLLLIAITCGVYAFIWCLKHEDRALVRKYVRRGVIAAVVGTIITVLITNIDRFTN